MGILIIFLGQIFGGEVLDEGNKYCQFLIHARVMHLDLYNIYHSVLVSYCYCNKLPQIQ